MKTYEKPWAEIVKFEAESILLDLQDVGDVPTVSEGVEDW